jgi:hypothetical protein
MASYIGRRNFLATLGGAAVGWPLAARAQQPGLPVVGLVWVAGERVVKPYEESIRAGLRELGWIDGGNVRRKCATTAAIPELRQNDSIDQQIEWRTQ